MYRISDLFLQYLISKSEVSRQFSRESAIITRSSTDRSSPDTLARNTRNIASITMMKSRGLSTDSLTLMYSNLHGKFIAIANTTLTQLREFTYFYCTRRTIHTSTRSFRSAHQITFRGTQSKAFLRSRNIAICFLPGIFLVADQQQKELRQLYFCPGQNNIWSHQLKLAT